MILVKNILDKIAKNKWSRHTIFITLIVLAGTLIYLPGLSGPFLFDDRTNILENEYLKIGTLDRESLLAAAFSVESGPLRRPISMLSFALNYYLSGESFSAIHFKITNLAIHLLNGLLVFWLFRLIFNYISRKNSPSYLLLSSWPHHATTSAFIVSILWLVNPIQLTSVLYVVQRMTSLSALFVLLGLICYLIGRFAMLDNKKHGLWIIITGTSVFGTLGILSKENAILLPLFVLAIEITLISRVRVLTYWDNLTAQKKYIFLAALILITASFLLWATNYVSPSYSHRSFSLSERLYTESRMIFYYLNLIVLPRLNEFGIFHDDILVSKDLISPLTTLFSVVGIFALLALAFRCLRKLPLISLGIFWFFTGHLIESTILPLEIAHEHRNYLASIGPMLIILNLTSLAARKTGRNIVFIIFPLFVLLFSVNTALRSWHWSDSASLYNFEAENHPHSARAQAGLGSFYAQAGNYNNATKLMLRASLLRPTEASDLINVAIIEAWKGKTISSVLQNEIVNRLEIGLISPLTNQTLSYATNCISNSCINLRDKVGVWLEALLSRSDLNKVQISFYHYKLAHIRLLQGKITAAIVGLVAAISANPSYSNPYILLINIYISQGQIRKATATLSTLKIMSSASNYSHSRAIEILGKNIEKRTEEKM